MSAAPGVRDKTAQRIQMPAEAGVAIVLAAVLIYFSVRLPDFRSEANLRLLVKQAAELAIISTGMTLVIATGGIDISVGSVMAFCAMTLGWLTVEKHIPLALACLGAIALGGLCGGLNGVLISRAKLPPIIVTLAMFAAASAAASMFNNGHSISGLPTEFNEAFDRRNILHLPVLFWIAAVTLGVGAIVLKFTTFGRELLALGGNRTAAHLSGMPTVRTETLVYLASGALAGLAAVVNVAKQATATQGTGQFMELTAITAVVLGGTVITGGKATLLGTALGVFTIGAIQSGVRLFGQEDQLAWFLVGAALLIAVEAQKWRAPKSL
jgi:ribose/xylose/arabinose/galactoside ABC-type transport system permease subunit